MFMQLFPLSAASFFTTAGFDALLSRFRWSHEAAGKATQLCAKAFRCYRGCGLRKSSYL